MGQALARAMLASEHSTVIWNRSPDKASALVAQGAALTATVAEAVHRSSMVIGCVRNYEALRATLDGINDWSDTTLINLTTGQPDEARDMADWAGTRGIDYLEGAILTPTPMIGTPAASILYCGPDAVFKANRGTLAALGGTPTHLGADFGAAAAYDLALLDLFSMAVSGVVHSFALASAEGISPRVFATYAAGIGGLLPEMINRFAGQLIEGRFPGERSTIASASSGISHIIEAANKRNIDTIALHAIKAVIDRAIAAGHSEDGLARLAQVLRP
jgi:3-hydroxyisobutyrate dehydrogenase-like beta-hydroxyacid dehydrogenase